MKYFLRGLKEVLITTFTTMVFLSAMGAYIYCAWTFPVHVLVLVVPVAAVLSIYRFINFCIKVGKDLEGDDK